MLFNSFEFLLGFLPATLVIFFLIAKKSNRAAEVWLVIASIIFYGWWNWNYVPLLMVSIIFNHLAAKVIARIGVERKSLWLAKVPIIINLLVLFYFKYFNFVYLELEAVYPLEWSISQIILPLGISFFTFTQIAYLIDVRRGFVRDFDFIDYCLFVTYFPHLIAGPLIHHKQVIPQFHNSAVYNFNCQFFAEGLAMFTLGLAKKVLIADNLSKYATPVFAASLPGSEIHSLVALCGALAFTFQLYFDFSGYSDMAIGLSRMIGIDLPRNFFSPYKSRNVIDFWRRWHITLSTFLRDYLYISLGGNRHGEIRRYLAIVLTMLLGGLWHGANWTFLVWGGYHGVLLSINHLWRRFMLSQTEGGGRWALPSPISWVLTFVAVNIGWVIFRADNLNAAWVVIKSTAKLPTEIFMLIGDGALGDSMAWLGGVKDFYSPLGLSVRAYAIYLVGSLIVVTSFPASQQIILGDKDFAKLKFTLMNGMIIGCIMAICIISLAEPSEFLYFQF